MQCPFDTKYMRGGYSIDKKDHRIRNSYVPIGLNTFGEDEYMEQDDHLEPSYFVYQEKTQVIPDRTFEQFVYLVEVEPTRQKPSSLSHTKKLHKSKHAKK